jgi:Holliday junction resolvasome RuvABC endonuclease subunit
MIIGVDPGLRKVTLACSEGMRTHIQVARSERWRELNEIRDEIRLLMARWAQVEKIDRIYLEEPVVAGARNLRATIGIAETAGVVLSLGIPVTLVPVSSWKKAVIGSGRASKEDVAEWFTRTYPEAPGHQDIYDATAILHYGDQDMDLADRVRSGGLSASG